MIHWHRLPAAGLRVLALAVILALIAPAGPASLAAGGTIHVDVDATGTPHDGSTWAKAYTDLQSALTAASSGQQIWVAEGTYRPALAVGSTGTHYQSFQLANGVALYGGFDPTTFADTFEERNWKTNLTILSGDLSGDDGENFANNTENSYHVIYGGATLNSTAILDGFTITGGNANGSSEPDSLGGGMLNYGSPMLTHCTFLANYAVDGGGMYNYGSPTLTNCIFAGNTADSTESLKGMGGGVYSKGGSPQLTNCIFSGNSARDGGGMYNNLASSVLAGCTFSGNSTHEASAIAGAAMTNANMGSPPISGTWPTLTNCILWGNGGATQPQIKDAYGTPTYTRNCDIQYGYPGPGNIGGDLEHHDPEFVDPDGADNVAGTVDDDLRLARSSPAINAGDKNLLPADAADLNRNGNTTEDVPYDMDHSPRVDDINAEVDMGAYERQDLPAAPVVTALPDGHDVLLSFDIPYLTANISYKVYGSSSNPWFAVISGGTLLTGYPSGTACALSALTITCTIRNVLGSTSAYSYFYVVRASYDDDEGAIVDSNRTGAIEMPLAPGD